MSEPLTHYWRSRRLLPGRHGEPCRLLVWRRRNCLIEFADGERVRTVGACIRRLPAEEATDARTE